MAKKYLLYIHDERFNKEQKKSELINGLLADYYGGAEIIPPKLEINQPIVELKPCKHGYSPLFCRHAKNGKPCK